jgi:hypothetical protein
MLEEIKTLDSINNFHKIGLIYYENSGENLIRFYLENIFKIKTGCNIKKFNNKIFNLKPSCDKTFNNWIISSDFPLRNKDEYENEHISLAILLIRNPIDLIMMKILKETFTFEEALIKMESIIDEWKEFNKYWISSPIPIHIIRYEDLLVDSKNILENMCNFLLGISSITNSKLDYAIRNVTEMNIDKIYFAEKIEQGTIFNNKFIFSNKENFFLIQKKFMEKLSRILNLFNYNPNSDDDTENWLVENNKENLIKSVEFHELLINQYMTTNYYAMKIA